MLVIVEVVNPEEDNIVISQTGAVTHYQAQAVGLETMQQRRLENKHWSHRLRDSHE